MLSSGFQHSVRHRALWKTDQCWNHMFQRSQILDELIPFAHTESSITFSSRSAPARDSVVNLLYHLPDHCLEDFFLWMISFGLEDSSDWKFLVYGFSASWARSRSGSNSRNVISWGFGFLLCWFELLMRHFTIILVVLNFSNCGFLLYSVYPLSFWDKNGEFFFALDGECISRPFKCFLSQNGQRESLLVFYIGNILVDKNTLCNGCFLIELSVLFRVFK